MLPQMMVRDNSRAQISDMEIFSATLKQIGLPLHVHPGAEICGENEPSDYLYDVISGAVRTCKVLSDGRRQIGAFYLSGDIFGLEGSNTHAFSAEAITDATILVIKRSLLASLASTNIGVARHLWMLTGAELQHVNNHTLAMVLTAQERVIGFLLEMAQRLAADADIDLPMTRQDIADYLGLRIETVSRVFTDLESAGAIARSTARHRHIVLRNASKLRFANV